MKKLRPQRIKDITGLKFGLITVKHICDYRTGINQNIVMWRGICECGVEKDYPGASLRSGNTKSCGCARNETLRKMMFKHGKNEHPEYVNWICMKGRCEHKGHPSYAQYGGMGITMCKEWSESFLAFKSDMGPKPFPKATIDRIDNSKGYYKENCRWANYEMQARNKKANYKVILNGKQICLMEACEILGMNYGTVKSRIRDGWSIDDALHTPVRFLSPKGFGYRSRINPGASYAS